MRTTTSGSRWSRPPACATSPRAARSSSRMSLGSSPDPKAVAFNPRGLVSLKGLDHPTAVAAVRWEPASRPGEFELPLPARLQVSRSSVFVGRAEEHARLLDRMKVAEEGTVQVALVSGGTRDRQDRLPQRRRCVGARAGGEGALRPLRGGPGVAVPAVDRGPAPGRAPRPGRPARGGEARARPGGARLRQRRPDLADSLGAIPMPTGTSFSTRQSSTCSTASRWSAPSSSSSTTCARRTSRTIHSSGTSPRSRPASGAPHGTFRKPSRRLASWPTRWPRSGGQRASTIGAAGLSDEEPARVHGAPRWSGDRRNGDPASRASLFAETDGKPFRRRGAAPPRRDRCDARGHSGQWRHRTGWPAPASPSASAR